MIKIEEIIGEINNEIIDKFNNKYEIINKITNGYVADIYLVKNKNNNNKLILKINNKKENYYFNLILNEIKIYNEIKNIFESNACEIFDTYILEDYKIGFFILEKITCEKGRYFSKLKRNKLLEMLNLIEKLHNNNIYHLDLHADNFGFKNNNIIIFDFVETKILEKENYIYKLADLIFFSCIYENNLLLGHNIKEKLIKNYNNNIINDIKKIIQNNNVNIKLKKILFYILLNYYNKDIYKDIYNMLLE